MSNNVRSGSRVLLIALTEDVPGPLPLGIVSNFDVQEQHQPETHKGVGSMHPRSISYHGTGGATVSWSRVTTVPEESYQALGILPQHRRLPLHRPITLLAVDEERGETLARINDCLPSSFALNIGESTSLRENCSFMGTYVQHAAELN